MSLERFIEDREPSWRRHAELVERVQRHGPRAVAGADLRQLAFGYRDISADLARLRSFDADPDLIRWLNRSVSRAHALIYRRSTRRGLRLGEFFLVQYPRLFRRYWRYTLASLLISASFAFMAYHTVQAHPEMVADVLGGADGEMRGAKTASDIKDRFQALPSPVLSSLVTTNNIRVALTAFALGATFGIGTVWVLVVNGTMVGGFAGCYAYSDAGYDFWITILPHGALELSAIVIAGGAGLIMGYALWCPGTRTRGRALRESAAVAVRIAVGLVPAFLVAGFFEGFLTPNTALPDELKAGIGIATALVYWGYLLLAGRHAPAAAPPTAGWNA